MASSLASRLLRCAWEDTRRWWRDHGLWLDLYLALTIPLFVALSPGKASFWEKLLGAGAAGIAALMVLVSAIFVRNLRRAPERLRAERIKPQSFVATVYSGPADRLQLEATDLLKAVETYRPWREIIRHGSVNDDLADRHLRELNAVVQRFGESAGHATIEDGNQKRRKAARDLAQQVGIITHESDLDEINEAVRRFMRQP